MPWIEGRIWGNSYWPFWDSPATVRCRVWLDVSGSEIVMLTRKIRHFPFLENGNMNMGTKIKSKAWYVPVEISVCVTNLHNVSLSEQKGLIVFFVFHLHQGAAGVLQILLPCWVVRERLHQNPPHLKHLWKQRYVKSCWKQQAETRQQEQPDTWLKRHKMTTNNMAASYLSVSVGLLVGMMITHLPALFACIRLLPPCSALDAALSAAGHIPHLQMLRCSSAASEPAELLWTEPAFRISSTCSDLGQLKEGIVTCVERVPSL